MAYPYVTISNGTDADSQMLNMLIAAGFVMPAGGLSVAQLHSAALALIYGDTPPAQRILTSAGAQVGTLGSVALSLNGAAGAVSSVNTLTRLVTAIADNTATTVLTITVPNAAHGALIRVDMVGFAGAGGAIGAFEDVTGVSYNIAVARTAGVAMGATVSTAYGSAAAVVAGAGTMTCVGAITLNGEGVGVANTASFKATIDQSSTSANHRCLVMATIINSQAAGITLS
jgi:hypothetical protein